MIAIEIFAEGFLVLLGLGVVILVITLITLFVLVGVRRRVVRDVRRELMMWVDEGRVGSSTNALEQTIERLNALVAALTRERDLARKNAADLESRLAVLAEVQSRGTVRDDEPETPPQPAPGPSVSTSRRIVTRTTMIDTGVRDEEFVESTWSEAQDRRLLGAYFTHRNIERTAIELQVDQKQVAARLVRLLLDPLGDIHDPSVENWGKRYTSADTNALLTQWKRGDDLSEIADALGRDQLGIGWKLLDHSSRPVELVKSDIPKIAKFATFGRA